MDKIENPQAFPGAAAFAQRGMTLRDWFAGQALAGFAASPAAVDDAWQDGTVAKCAYQLADAMLLARKEPTQ